MMGDWCGWGFNFGTFEIALRNSEPKALNSARPQKVCNEERTF